MNTLPDPRRYPPRGAPDRLLELARSSLATGDPIARSVHNDVLLSAIRACYSAGDDALVAGALAAAPATAGTPASAKEASNWCLAWVLALEKSS